MQNIPWLAREIGHKDLDKYDQVANDLDNRSLDLMIAFPMDFEKREADFKNFHDVTLPFFEILRQAESISGCILRLIFSYKLPSRSR